MIFQLNNMQGINTNLNPLAMPDGNIIRSVNLINEPFGAKRRRPGYTTTLGTANGSQVNTLFSWLRNNGTQQNLYRASGSVLYYSLQGTGAWTVAGNGTITAGSYVGHAVLNDTLIVGDNFGSTKHSTDGTTFTNTTLAPISNSFAPFQNRVYAAGTTNTDFYSTTNDLTNWSSVGTSDANSFNVSDEGGLIGLFNNNNQIVSYTTINAMFQWDGFSQADMHVNNGPASLQSVATFEGYTFWINQLGAYALQGNTPQLISNPIQKQFYNNAGSGIAAANFGSIPAVIHKYDYLAAVGTVTDDFTGETITNAILKYDYRLNMWDNWQFADTPTAFHSYIDTTGNKQLIFGGTGGQVFKFGGTAVSDNGAAITSILEFVVHGKTLLEKEFHLFRGLFNPGCEARVQYAIANTFTAQDKMIWQDMGQLIDGVIEYPFRSGTSRGRLLFIKITDSSVNSPFIFYSAEVEYDVVRRR